MAISYLGIQEVTLASSGVVKRAENFNFIRRVVQQMQIFPTRESVLVMDESMVNRAVRVLTNKRFAISSTGIVLS